MEIATDTLEAHGLVSLAAQLEVDILVLASTEKKTPDLLDFLEVEALALMAPASSLLEAASEVEVLLARTSRSLQLQAFLDFSLEMALLASTTRQLGHLTLDLVAAFVAAPALPCHSPDCPAAHLPQIQWRPCLLR